MEPPRKKQRCDSVETATLSTLKEFYAQGKYSDVTIEIEGEYFPCQRSILAAISKYFDAMFSNDFMEKDANTVVMYGIDASTFREILHLFFTGDETGITGSNVHLLLMASDFLQLRNSFVEDRCFEYLKQRTSDDSEPFSKTIEILSVSHATNMKRILHLLCVHVCKHFMHFVEDGKLMEVPFDILIAILSECRKNRRHDNMLYGQDYVEYVNDFLTSRYKQGNARLRLIISWLGHSRAERSQYRNKLMSYVDSSDLSIDYTLTLINNCENLVDDIVKRTDEVELPANHVKQMATLDPRNDTMAFATGTTIVIHGHDFSRTGPEFYLGSKVSMHGMRCHVTIENKALTDGLIISIELANRLHDSDVYASGGCLLKAHLTIIAKKEGGKDLIEYFQIDASECLSMYTHPLNLPGYTYLVREENGYIENDCVTFQLRLSFI